MNFEKAIRLKDLCKQFNVQFIGDGDFEIKGINEIHRVEEGDLIFIDNEKYFKRGLDSKASVIIVKEPYPNSKHKSLIIHENPFSLFNEIAHYFFQLKSKQYVLNSIDKTAIIQEKVILGKNVYIGSNTSICGGVVIGDNVRIGKNVVIGPNTVIGHNAFYYNKKAGIYSKMITCGSVEIKDNVEIGALCSIDNGVTSVTSIGQGTKIDNLVQIGHDTIIGKNCLIAAGVGIAGCVTIGNGVTLWGQVGIASGIDIGNDVVVLAQSGVSKSLASGKIYFGSPCVEAKQKFKELATLRILTTNKK